MRGRESGSAGPVCGPKPGVTKCVRHEWCAVELGVGDTGDDGKADEEVGSPRGLESGVPGLLREREGGGERGGERVRRVGEEMVRSKSEGES